MTDVFTCCVHVCVSMYVMVVTLWGVHCLICTHDARGRVRTYQVMHDLRT